MNPKEALFWSIALPGLGQLLNHKYVKGITLIALEFLINVQSNFNLVIFLSFHGRIQEAIQTADYQWLMFYPCVYLFGLWDAYKDAGGGAQAYSFMPFVFAAFFVTIGLIYSDTFRLLGVTFGPVWLPILALIPGIVVGIGIKSFLAH